MSTPSIAPTPDGAIADTATSKPDGTTVDTSTADSASDSTTADGSPDAATETLADASSEVSCIGDAAAIPDSDAADETGKVITKSVVDPTMTLEKFTAMCNERGGVLEQHSHCGGANSCKGMSYDTGTQVYTEHTCKYMNTCTGFSCVLGC